MDSEAAVYDRYSAASRAVQPELCCPVSYSGDYLAVIPQEVLERDYGCGDPSPWVQPGETVLDLGAGGGKLAFILSQIVGPEGRVIGVDCNADMLALARRHHAAVAASLGYDNIVFHNGLIQDLRLDLDRLQHELEQRPVRSTGDWLELRSIEDRLRRTSPLVADASVDCVVSNCVLNLVRQTDRRQLFEEIFRVLRPGGRAAISDIVADRDVPEALQHNPELWSGCLSGAFREDRFLQAFEAAGFHGLQIVRRQPEPWRVVAGIEFRSMTVVAHKPREAKGETAAATVIYAGPFREVRDDAGRVYRRGERVTVDAVTSERLKSPPFSGLFWMLDGPSNSRGAPLITLPTTGCCGGTDAC